MPLRFRKTRYGPADYLFIEDVGPEDYYAILAKQMTYVQPLNVDFSDVKLPVDIQEWEVYMDDYRSRVSQYIQETGVQYGYYYYPFCPPQQPSK